MCKDRLMGRQQEVTVKKLQLCDNWTVLAAEVPAAEVANEPKEGFTRFDVVVAWTWPPSSEVCNLVDARDLNLAIVFAEVVKRVRFGTGWRILHVRETVNEDA